MRVYTVLIYVLYEFSWVLYCSVVVFRSQNCYICYILVCMSVLVWNRNWNTHNVSNSKLFVYHIHIACSTFATATGNERNENSKMYRAAVEHGGSEHKWKKWTTTTTKKRRKNIHSSQAIPYYSHTMAYNMKRDYTLRREKQQQQKKP